MTKSAPLSNQSPSTSTVATATTNQGTPTLEKQNGAVKHPMLSPPTSEKIPCKMTKKKAEDTGELSDD